MDRDMEIMVKIFLKEQGMSQSDLAKKVGLTRQRIFDMLKRENTGFNNMEKVMKALGYKIAISRKDWKALDFNEEEFYAAIKKSDPMFGKLRNILDAMGYKTEIVKMDEEIEA